jgi:hypothetical protein
MPPPYQDMDALRSGTVEEYVAFLRQNKMHACYSGEVVEIHFLMAAMDTFGILEWWDDDNSLKDNNWQPKSEQIRECIRRLIAHENRPALRAWYQQFQVPEAGETNPMILNSAAERLRRYLSCQIGEKLW